jgi:MoaA/NifB/PqqE/SkfB family radical SAM enzyme
MSKAAGYLSFAPRILRKEGWPLYLVFFVTRNCTAHCSHCLLGERASTTNELSLAEIETMASSMGPLLFLLLTGGEPFLRDDLASIAEVFSHHTGVLNIGIPTNGSLTDRVITTTRAILEKCPGVDLAVDVSLDGIGPQHDAIRGVPGLFDKAVTTFKELRQLATENPGFNANVAVTVSRRNERYLLDLYRFLKEELGVRTINHLLVRGRPREPDTLAPRLEAYHDFSVAMETDARRAALPGYGGYPFSSLLNAMKVVRREIIEDTVGREARVAPCYAGTLSCVVYSKGEVHPCELLPQRFGDLRDHGMDFGGLWHGDRASEIRRYVGSERCHCTYECFLTNSVMFTPALLPRVFREWLRQRGGPGQTSS